MKTHVTSLSETAGNLVSLKSYLDGVGVTPVTGWRWRKKGWLPTVNICGRVYVSGDAIANFETRAAAGEFAQDHKAPTKRTGKAGQ